MRINKKRRMANPINNTVEGWLHFTVMNGTKLQLQTFKLFLLNLILLSFLVATFQDINNQVLKFLPKIYNPRYPEYRACPVGIAHMLLRCILHYRLDPTS